MAGAVCFTTMPHRAPIRYDWPYPAPGTLPFPCRLPEVREGLYTVEAQVRRVFSLCWLRLGGEGSG